MTKKIILITIIILAAVCVAAFARSGTNKEVNSSIYLPDMYQITLVRMDAVIKKASTQRMANQLMNIISRNHKYNSTAKIFPNVENGITVKVRKNVAIVNLSKEFTDKHSGGSSGELLTIYSIVNTLTSLEGIDLVKFKIDNKFSESFKGHVDISEDFYFNDKI